MVVFGCVEGWGGDLWRALRIKLSALISWYTQCNHTHRGPESPTPPTSVSFNVHMLSDTRQGSTHTKE